MLGQWRSHNAYRHFVITNLKIYENEPSPIIEYLDIILKLFICNLDRLKDTIMRHYYHIGRAAIRQPEIFRILLLMLHLNLTPIDCIKKLKANHVLRVACGLMIDEIPNIATLYNFMYRIVGHGDRPAVKNFRRKPSFKLTKGEKLPPKHSGIMQKLKIN